MTEIINKFKKDINSQLDEFHLKLENKMIELGEKEKSLLDLKGVLEEKQVEIEFLLFLLNFLPLVELFCFDTS